jgi:hypothetical protein
LPLWVRSSTYERDLVRMIGEKKVSDVILKVTRKGEGFVQETYEVWLNRSMISHKFAGDENISE